MSGYSLNVPLLWRIVALRRKMSPMSGRLRANQNNMNNVYAQSKQTYHELPIL